MNEEIPLSRTLTDAQIARILGECQLESSPENIELVRETRKRVEKALADYEAGKPLYKIFEEARVNSFRRN